MTKPSNPPQKTDPAVAKIMRDALKPALVLKPVDFAPEGADALRDKILAALTRGYGPA